MYRKGLKVTACSLASALVLAGTTVVPYAAPIAGVSQIASVGGTSAGSLVSGVSLCFSKYLTQSEQTAKATANTTPVVQEAGDTTAAAPAAATPAAATPVTTPAAPATAPAAPVATSNGTAATDAGEPVSEYANVAIAQVDNYVNIRSAANADSDVVGKLYNNSEATVLSTEGDWYKITSGSVTGYVKSQYVVCGNEELARSVSRRVAKVTTQTLFVRTSPTTDSDVLGMVPIEDELTVTDESNPGWVKVSIEEGDGYVSTDYVTLSTEYVHAESKAEEAARLAKEQAEREAAQKAAQKAADKAAKKDAKKTAKASGSSNGSNAAPSGSGGGAVASYAEQFIGNPYVFGGTSLTNGTDCSGFVMSVYAAFGVSLPHSSSALRSCGYEVSPDNMQPGDIVCYSGHVAICAGGGSIVHASTPESGIKCSNANYKTILSVRRIF